MTPTEDMRVAVDEALAAVCTLCGHGFADHPNDEHPSWPLCGPLGEDAS